MPDGLAELFLFAAKDLEKHLTPDPAGVSKPIKLLEDRKTVVGRLERAAKSMKNALDNDGDPQALQEAMASLYWKYVNPPNGSNSKVAFASALRSGETPLSVSAGALSLGASGTPALKRTQSYGSESA